jgi:hypothetical protein
LRLPVGVERCAETLLLRVAQERRQEMFLPRI